ncbi:MAG: DivIVA domain-containing protein [Actinomycetota bacterium]|nr:DivIVA domain-containing protein [Actinomycetota bacterium]
MFTPEEIASRQFLIALRGYDRDEVTTFLGRVAEDYRSLVTRAQELETELEQASTDFKVSTDPLEAFRQLGEETTRILVAAEEAAIQLRQRAEEETRAELEAARRTATEELDTARRSAAEELQHARRTAAEELQQARRTAAEELDEARRAASEELEQAHRSAQETIAAANRHRAEVADIVRELQEARQRLADDLAGAVQSVEATVVRLRSGPLEEAAAAALAAAQEPTTVEAPGPGPAVAAEAATSEAPGAGGGGLAEAAYAPPPAAQASAETVTESTEASAEPQRSSAAEAVAPTGDLDVEQAAVAETPDVTAEAMEAPRGDMLVEAAPLEEMVEAQPEREQRAEAGVAEAASHELRDQALAGVRPGMLRRLKRTLQDVQNGVVDALRRSDGQVDPSELPPFADDLAPLGSIGEAFLAEAYRTGIADGATLAGVTRREDAADPARVDDAARAFRDTLAYEIDASLEATLRAGIEAGEETSMLIERVDGIFRDLKGPVSEAAVDASLVRVYELGLQDLWRATGVESRVWVVGPEQRCPENRCQLNAERGQVALDEQFPSGDYVPPAHPGCTCTIAPG